MHQIEMTVQIWRKGCYYIAYSPELDFISQGESLEEAKKNLLEVTEIQFEEMSKKGTLQDYLEECGFKVGKEIKSEREFVGFEKATFRVAI